TRRPCSYDSRPTWTKADRRNHMTNLLWAGDHRAGDALTDRQVADAMVRVERAWLTVLVDLGLAPAAALGSDAAAWALADDDIVALAIAAEAAGNPAVPLVALLRERLPEQASQWVHRGLT